MKQNIIAILSAVLLLSACDFQAQYEKRKQNFRQPEKTVQVENTPQKQAKKALPTPPNELQIQSYTHNQQYCFDTKDPNRCSTAKLTRLEVTNLSWLTELLNQQIQWDSKKDESQLLESLKKSTLNDSNEANAYTLNTETAFAFLGKIDHFAVFERQDYVYYELAAHPNQSIYYLVVDLQKGEVVSLDNILTQPEKQNELTQKLQTLFHQQLRQHNMSEEEIKQFNIDFPFSLSSNWRFAKQGLIFQYNPYDIAPYAFGTPQIFIENNQLKEIIKPEYLNISEKWVENKPFRQPENNKTTENNSQNEPVYQQFVPPPQEREEFNPRSDFE